MSRGVLGSLRRIIEERLPPNLEVPIADCVHYGAFRYGGVGFHPYESYMTDIAAGGSVVDARRRFIDFICHYRPRHLAEALGVTGVTGRHPLWLFPWTRRGRHAPAWLPRPEDGPDIITHYSEAGILSHRIDEEFFWLERALRAMRVQGYRPTVHGAVQVQDLVRRDGLHAYLLRDGNHRVGALHALGEKVVAVRRAPIAVREDEVDEWPGVRSHAFTKDDALAVFASFFAGNISHRTVAEPARIVAPPGWKELYA